MMNKKYPIPQQVFDNIYAQVPRLTVELIVKTPENIFPDQAKFLKVYL